MVNQDMIFKNKMNKLLIKFPSRQRPGKFFRVLDQYIKFANKPKDIIFSITLDSDDETMNNQAVIDKLNQYKSAYPDFNYHFGNSKTKIQAVNADVPDSGWGVVLLASDDMIPVVRGYDSIILNEMQECYPDTDGVLWFYDGHREDLNTLCILGKKYYDRFGYIYQPDYITWYADNEFMEVAQRLGKQTAYTDCIVEHKHPVWTGEKTDQLYRKENQKPDITHDKQLYEKRFKENFGIYKLSILVCTIESRKQLFNRLMSILEPQITNEVELLYSLDNRGNSIGFKRNELSRTKIIIRLISVKLCNTFIKYYLLVLILNYYCFTFRA